MFKIVQYTDHKDILGDSVSLKIAIASAQAIKETDEVDMTVLDEKGDIVWDTVDGFNLDIVQ